jgi:hypothetical protein
VQNYCQVFVQNHHAAAGPVVFMQDEPQLLAMLFKVSACCAILHAPQNQDYCCAILHAPQNQDYCCAILHAPQNQDYVVLSCTHHRTKITVVLSCTHHRTKITVVLSCTHHRTKITVVLFCTHHRTKITVVLFCTHHRTKITVAALAVSFQNEPQLLAMLDEVRQGLFSQQTRHILAGLQRPLAVDDGIKPTELFPTNEQVWRWVCAVQELLLVLLAYVGAVVRSTGAEQCVWRM